MSQTVQTPFGTGTVVDRESVRGRVSYKVEGPGFSTWIEAAAMPVDFQWMPGPDEVQDNSVTLPYNPAPQTWRNPSDQNIVPGRQEVDPERRTHPADSVDFQEEAEEYVPGPAPHLFAGSLSPEDIQAKLGPKYVNAFETHDFTSLQARIDENPELVLAEYKERVAELVMEADSEYLERIGRNEYLEASDPDIREAAWKDVRAKAVRLRRSGQVNLQAANPDIIATQVTGDHGTYECLVVRSNIFQGNSAVDSWSCNCPWGQWAFKREHKFVGRLCSHAYASLLELQALMKSKAVNPRFRNTPGIMASRTAEVVDIGSKIFHRDYADIYGTVVEDDGDAYLVDGPGGEYWIDHEDARLASRTASSLDHYWEFVEWAEDNGYDEFDRDSLSIFIQDNLLQGEAARGLIREWEESMKMASRTADAPSSAQILTKDGWQTVPFHRFVQFEFDSGTVVVEVELDGEIQQLELPRQQFRMSNQSSRTAEIVDLRPVGWDPYSRNLMNRLRDLWEEGERPGRQKERNEEIRELVDELRERGFATDGVIASIQRTAWNSHPNHPEKDAQYIKKGDVWGIVYRRESPNGDRWFWSIVDSEGNQRDRDGGGSSSEESAKAEVERALSKYAFIDRPLGYGDIPDYGTSEDYVLRHELQHREDVTEPEFEYTPGTDDGVVNDLNDGGRNLTSAYEDDYQYGEPPAYGSGDEYGGDENPYYVDPAEQTDWDDPLPDNASEDDIVANFQKNAAWLMGGNDGGSGGNDDIAAAAEAHLRTAGRHFTMAEQQALIDEDDGLPYDRSQLRLDGTHYL